MDRAAALGSAGALFVAAAPPRQLAAVAEPPLFLPGPLPLVRLLRRGARSRRPSRPARAAHELRRAEDASSPRWLVEYCLHRFLFHASPASYWGITLHYAFHGCHHKYPNDRLRLVRGPPPRPPHKRQLCRVGLHSRAAREAAPAATHPRRPRGPRAGFPARFRHAPHRWVLRFLPVCGAGLARGGGGALFGGSLWVHILRLHTPLRAQPEAVAHVAGAGRARGLLPCDAERLSTHACSSALDARRLEYRKGIWGTTIGIRRGTSGSLRRCSMSYSGRCRL